MAKVYIKIVGIEGDSVLVKYSSDKSAKSVDDYAAEAYQPKLMGYTNLDDFIKGITPSLSIKVTARDAAEVNSTDLSSWVNHSSIQDLVHPTVDTNGVPVVYDSSAEVLL
jgi:hypothetical protein